MKVANHTALIYPVFPTQFVTRHSGTVEFVCRSAQETDIDVDEDLLDESEREHLKMDVSELAETVGIDNWDGDGALALDDNTATAAMELIDKLPGNIEVPDVSATPQGEIDLDWCVGRRVMLTVSIGPSSEIAFAGMFEDALLSGKEPWSGEVPKFVRCCLERLEDFRSE